MIVRSGSDKWLIPVAQCCREGLLVAPWIKEVLQFRVGLVQTSAHVETGICELPGWACTIGSGGSGFAVIQ